MQESENTHPDRFWKYIRFLVEPPPNITDTWQRHQTRLLSALILIIITLGGLSGMIQLLMIPSFFPTFTVILGGIGVLCLAYFIARTKYYFFAATLTALTPLIASYEVLRHNTGDQSAFVFMLISVLMSGVLLTRRLTLGVAFLNLMGLILLPVIQPAWTFAMVSGQISFHIIVSALILVSMWHRDLIERDRQKELSESELKFRSIFDHSVDAIGVSLDGVHVMVNPAYVRMFGRNSVDDFQGRSILDLIAPSERATIQENVRRRSMGANVPAMYETRGMRSDGTEFDMEVRVSTYELDGGRYAVPILRDITERKKAEGTLRASEEVYKLLFESNPQPMWVYDTNSLAFLAVNDEAVSKYGYSKEEFLGMTIKDIRPEDDIPRLMDNVAHLSTGLDHAGHWRHQKKDGSFIDVEITSHVLVFDGRQAELVLANDITARKAAEKALQESLLRQTAILDNIPDLAWLKDEESRFIAVNEPFAQACGLASTELIGKTDLEIWSEELAQGYRKDDFEVMRSGKRKHVEERLVDSAGCERWVETAKTPIFDTGGKLIGMAGISRDITERKRMEDALQKSELHYRAIVENTTDLICRFLPDTTLLFVNEAYCRYFGRNREQLNGTQFLDLIPEGDWEGVRSHVRHVFETQKPVTYSHEVVTSGGEIRWQQWTDSVILNNRGEVVELQSVGRDITEQRQIEDALRNSQRRLSTAMRATKIGVWEWDIRTNKAYWSDENYKVLGLEPGSIEAKYENWAKCLHPDDAPAANAKVSEALLNRSDLNIEFRVLWSDGSIHWINDIGSLMLNEKGEPLGMYGIQMDVTERKRAEEERERLIGELEAKNAELERFTYTVSHDLKSPLVTIKGFLGFVHQDIASGSMERLHNDLERIGSATKKMEQLLWDLLELSRIGRLVQPSEEIPFDDLAREALDVVHGQLTARGVAVHVQPNLPIVFGDRQRLIEVLQNLFDNAAKYMGMQADPIVEIGFRGMEDDKCIFYVRDNGMGIMPQHHERVFGLFNKLDVHSEGTGVGLALVKRIVEFHGGRIWIESEGNNSGATFCFTLCVPPR